MDPMKPKSCDSEKTGSPDEAPLLEQWLNRIEPLIMVGRITPEVIHDINNQLTGILGYAELLSMKKIEDESIKNGLKNIYLSAEKCKEILANLLSFSRQETSGVSLTDVNDAIKKTVELRTCAWRHRQIGIVKDLGTDIPVLPVDGIKLQKVFMALSFMVEESLEDGHPGKRIIFKTAFSPEEQAIIIRISADGLKQFPDRILNFFASGQEIESLDPETEFGLNKARQLVKTLGGTLEITSAKEEGSTFVIHLPVKG
jgi:two-component system NtrC family sensor kinase